MSGAFDRDKLIEALRRIHCAEGSEEEWILSLATGLRDLVPDARMCVGSAFRIEGEQWEHRSLQSDAHRPGWERVFTSRPCAPEDRELLAHPVRTVRRTLRWNLPTVLEAFRESVGSPVGDALSILGVYPGGEFLGVCVVTANEIRWTKPVERAWYRVAAHLAGIGRLRALHTPDALRGTDGAAAVFDPERGTLVHREALVEDEGALAIRRAAVDADRLRARATRDAAGEPLDVWQAMVEGTYSLMDVHEENGRRFVVARRNTQDEPRTNGLDPLETQVTSLLAMGHQSKYVAYELGLSEARVSRLLASARRKLGANSTTALLQALEAARATRQGGDHG